MTRFTACPPTKNVFAHNWYSLFTGNAEDFLVAIVTQETIVEPVTVSHMGQILKRLTVCKSVNRVVPIVLSFPMIKER